MVRCNIRLLSYASAGINLILMTSIAIAMIVIMVMHKDKSRKVENEKSGIATIEFDKLVYIFLASISGLACTILLVQGIRLDRHKLIYYYYWPMGLLLIMWCFISLNILFANIKVKKPIGSIILQFGLCILLIVLEVILFVPITKVYKEIKNKPFTSSEMYSLNRH